MIKRFFYRILCGFLLGVSIFAPGFSGSVIAIIMGIYKDILRIVSNPFKQFKQNVKFCIPLGIGALISAVLFVISFSFLFDTYEKATYLLFVGLVAGNLPVIFGEVKKCGFQKRYLIGGGLAFAIALFLGISATGFGHSSAAEGLTIGLPIMALGGFAAGITALMPGMSVSMILMIMGVYAPLLSVTKSVIRLDVASFIPFGLFGVCAVAGLVLASRGIKIVFERFPGFANSMILGFMTGSIISIFIQSMQIKDTNFNWLVGCLMLAAGLAVSILFVFLGKTMNKDEN